jgi:hypothetical protein
MHGKTPGTAGSLWLSYFIVTIQNPISIPLALHLDVASRHMKFQKTAHSCKHDSRFSSISHGAE